MGYALLILLAMLHSSAVEVWTGGDDGLTQRFAELFRAATASIPMTDERHQIQAIVEQIVPKRGGKIRTVVRFERNKKQIGASRCNTRKENFAVCVARASAAARRLAANV